MKGAASMATLPAGTHVTHRNYHFHPEGNRGHTQMMEMAHELFDRFFSGSPENGGRDELVDSLTDDGWEVDVLDNRDGDVLILELTMWSITRSVRLQHFIIQYAGHDAADISVWCPVAEASF
jgi:hypothetical protein